jgi:hexosaminidase
MIPYPNQIQMQGAFIDLSEGIKITGNSKYQKYLVNNLKDRSIQLDGSISLNLIKDKNVKGIEEYIIKCQGNTIEIKSSTDAGEFYGIQTFLQLINNKQLPEIFIKDKPRFKWRSYLLDEARHFQGKKVVKNILDEMARLKMNVFHWHLTDDQGWRIEIKKYPLLTKIGSKRDSTEVKRHPKRKYDGKPHSGFYTQEEIKEIVEYASFRNINIMPEIGMPGHASAAIAAYPYLGTNKKKIKVPCKFGVGADVYDPSSPKTRKFIEDVLIEVANLFPFNTIHIGGDEVRYDHWRNSKEVNKYKNKHALPTFSDIQVKFTNEISQFVESKIGKRIMGWNEILGQRVHKWSKHETDAKTKLSKKAIVQFWNGTEENFKTAIKRGHQVVNSNSRYTYLDKNYKTIPLTLAYTFNPIPHRIRGKEKNQIIGMGCQMWGESTRNAKDVYRRTFPRIAAYAEVCWTKEENKDYLRFYNSLPQLLNIWKSKGINYGSLNRKEN